MILADTVGFCRGAVTMNENSAWEYFRRTGSVRDYLAYTQCKANSEHTKEQREDRNENRCPGPGGFGETRG